MSGEDWRQQILPEVAAPTSLEWSDGGGYFVLSQMVFNGPGCSQTLRYFWILFSTLGNLDTFGYSQILSDTLGHSPPLFWPVLACPGLSWPVLACLGLETFKEAIMV